MIDLKGILYWLVIIFILYLLWPIIKWLVIFILIAAIVIFILNRLNKKDAEKNYIEREDYRKPQDDNIIDVEYKMKDKND